MHPGQRNDCLQKLNPYFQTSRAVMRIPLGEDSWGKKSLNNEAIGKIKDTLKDAKSEVSSNLKGEHKEALMSILNDIENEGEKTNWSYEGDFQQYIDDAKCYAELMLMDEAVKCMCPQE